jgi:hypothetical protein
MSSAAPTVPVPGGPGIMGPDYSFSDNIKLPGEVGVYSGDTMESVTDSLKAVSYYVDMIGFGEPSNPLSDGMPVQPLGVNFWSKTGLTCSNGADMWIYNETIPKGDALGQRVKNGLKSAGMPGLRGLGPGIVEDAKEALNPVPILSSMFGSSYPKCKYEIKPVGDQDGFIRKRLSNENGVLETKATGPYYIENPEQVQMINGKPHQGRWTFDRNISKEEWENDKKTRCPDGIPIKNHQNSNCNKKVTSLSQEGFTNETSPYVKNLLLLGILLVGSAVLVRKLKMRK